MSRFSIRSGQSITGLRTKNLTFAVEDRRNSGLQGQRGYVFRLKMDDSMQALVPRVLDEPSYPTIRYMGSCWKIENLLAQIRRDTEVGTTLGLARNFRFCTQVEAARVLEQNFDAWSSESRPSPEPPKKFVCTVNGKPLSLHQFRGKRVTILPRNGQPLKGTIQAVATRQRLITAKVGGKIRIFHHWKNNPIPRKYLFFWGCSS